MVQCMHGWGHGEWIRTLMPSYYGPCSSLADASWSPSAISRRGIETAFAGCRSVPPWLVSSCAHGFFHAYFEYVDFRAMDVSWLYPCDTGGIPHPERCFYLLFTTIEQASSPVSSPVMIHRRRAFEKHGNFSMCADVSPRRQPHCLWALGANIFGNPYGSYLERLAPAVLNVSVSLKAGPANWNFGHVCTRLAAMTSLQRSRAVERRLYLACVIGSIGGWPAKSMVDERFSLSTRFQACSHLLSSGPVTFREDAHRLCQLAARFNGWSVAPQGMVQDDEEPNEYGFFSFSRSSPPRNASLIGFGVYTENVESDEDDCI